MAKNYLAQIIDSPENPYGRNAERIQREASMRKMIAMHCEQLSSLETAVDFSQYTSK